MFHSVSPFLAVAALAILLVPATACAGKGASAQTGAAVDSGKAEATEAAAPTGTGVSGATADYESFKEALEEAKDDAEKTAILVILALVAYQKDQVIGGDMLVQLVRTKYHYGNPDRPDGVELNRYASDDLRHVRTKPYLLKGYCGGTLAKRYEDADLDACKPELDKEYSKDRQGVNYPKEGRAKFFVKHAGSSYPKPMELIHEDGRWRVYSYSGLMSVHPPEGEE